MNTDDFTKLYIISYVVSNSEEGTVTGYSTLAAKLEYLRDLIDSDDKLDNEYSLLIEELVSKADNKSLDWSSLKNLIERAEDDEYGSMFLEVRSSSIGPNKWTREFNSNAPDKILEKKFEDMIKPDQRTRLVQKMDTAATTSGEDVINSAYNL